MARRRSSPYTHDHLQRELVKKGWSVRRSHGNFWAHYPAPPGQVLPSLTMKTRFDYVIEVRHSLETALHLVYHGSFRSKTDFETVTRVTNALLCLSRVNL